MIPVGNIKIVIVYLLIPLNVLTECPANDWHLVWEDEFNTPTIDRTLWDFEIGNGCDRQICQWGNDEKQIYTDTEENAFTSNGTLIIQALHNANEYTSARMLTQGKGDWKFGRIEIRAKFPRGRGLLTDIWLLPSYNKYGIWPGSGHIDVAVRFGYKDGRQVTSILHYGAVYPDRQESLKNFYLDQHKKEVTESFYVYKVDWDEGRMKWFIDDELVHEFSNETVGSNYIYPFNEKFFLILSLAIGGRRMDTDVTETVFPQRFEVDYVRVYQKLCSV